MRWVLVGSMLTACADPDAFFVRRSGADLPVWVRGNPESDQVVVVQHGSGTSGALYDWMPAFDEIEQAHRVVYWDQRGAGISQGNAPANSLNLVDSVDDLELVLAVVAQELSPSRLTLLGHSLGGGISQSFLRDPVRSSAVDAYIDVAGARHPQEAYTSARNTIRDWAASRVEEHDRFVDMVAFYDEHLTFPREEPARSTHAANVEEFLLGAGFDAAASTAQMTSFLTRRGVADAWFGAFDPFAFLVNTSRFVSTYELDAVTLTPHDVSTIEVPALVLAGRHDLAVPVSTSEATFEALATAGAPIRFDVLEDSGHYPMWDEPEAFGEVVVEFLDAVP